MSARNSLLVSLSFIHEANAQSAGARHFFHISSPARPAQIRKSRERRLRRDRVFDVVDDTLPTNNHSSLPACRVGNAAADGCGVAVCGIFDAAVYGAVAATGRIENAAINARVLGAGGVESAAGNSRSKTTYSVQFTCHNSAESGLREPVAAADDQVV